MSEYEMVERRKLQLALGRIVDLEQAILRAARRLDEYVKQPPPDRFLMPLRSIVWELRAVARAGI